MNKFESHSGLPASFIVLLLSAVMAGCSGGGGSGGGGAAPAASSTIAGAPAGAIVPGAACTVAAGATIPTVTMSTPSSGNQLAATSTSGVAGGGKIITATFSLAMNPATISATTFTVTQVGGAALVPASVSYTASTNVATFTTSSALLANTTYVATVTTGATSAAGTAMACIYAWNFKTAATAASAPSAINLGSATTFGLASRAGLTSTGVTVVNGDIALSPNPSCTDATGGPGSAAVPPPGCAVKAYGSHSTGLSVNGSVFFFGDTDVPPGQTASVVSNDLQTAWNEGFSKVNTQGTIAADELGGPGPAGKVYIPGVYTNANLGFAAGLVATMDAQNDPDAVFIFQVGGVAPAGDFTDSGTTLLPNEIKLVNGAQAKNVWFVIGRDATIGHATKWNGNILSGRTVTVNDGSMVDGRVLAGASGAGALSLVGAATTVTSITVP